jgi:hypothetical protein
MLHYLELNWPLDSWRAIPKFLCNLGENDGCTITFSRDISSSNGAKYTLSFNFKS